MTTNDDPAQGTARPGSPTSYTPAEVMSIGAPLIGRDRELQLLLRNLYEVIEHGESRLVTVVGAAGIGKSRLAHELRQVVARLPDTVAVFSLQADRQSTAQPYSLIHLLVGALFHISEGAALGEVRARLEGGVASLLGHGSLEKAHVIGHLAGYDFADSPYLRSLLTEPRQVRDRALLYATQCLAALTAQTPVVLFIDDFHYADNSSLEAIAEVFAEGRGVGALVVCLAQQRLYERRPSWGGTRVDLGPLDEHAGRRLVGEILRKAGKLPSDLRAMIVSRAEGNPFYIEELIKMLIADRVIVPGPSAWQIRPGRLARLRIPSTLADLLRSRIQALSPGERDFLVRAAVVGRFFWADATLQLTDACLEYGAVEHMAALDTILTGLERKDCITRLVESRFPGQHEYAFRYELLHEVAYGQVPPDMRQVYHRRVAGWLIEHCAGRAAYAGLIADHFARGAHPRMAAHWYVLAGNHARETYAVEASLAHFRAALALLPDDAEAIPDRIACYEGLAETQAANARLGDAIASYTQMAELAEQAGDPAAAARAWNGLAYVQDFNLDYEAAATSACCAVELAESAGDARQLALALNHVAWAELRNDQPRAALELGRRALELLARIDDPDSAARCKCMIGLAYELLGDYDAARHSLLEALRHNREVRNLPQMATQLSNLGYTANTQGDYEAALTFLQEGLQVAHESQSRINEIYILTNLALTLNGLGDYALAEAEARRGITLCQASRITAYADFYCAISEACLCQGRVTEAVEAAQQALDTARTAEGPREVAAACRALGNAISAMSDSQGARPCYEESARIFAEARAVGEQARTLRSWACHELIRGDSARGRELWRQARELFARLGLTHELARTPADPA
ncbi:MAG: AAA family ATPase [Chloroflexales bacterium]|nr:AAA family ATPase [Chloroflexales bacterium]